jgi:serine/threonine-protein kinase
MLQALTLGSELALRFFVVPAPELSNVLALQGERRLVLGSEIGRGSQGVVRIARLEQILARSRQGEEVMGRTVAAKLIDPALCRDPETMQEIRRAVRRGALVSHANVVQITDYFVTSTTKGLASDPIPCILQEFVDGMSLAELIARCESVRRRIPLDLALFIGCEIAEGLAAARHARSIEGVILNMAHHALSPRQVLLSWNGDVKVGDFGWRPEGVVSGVRRSDRDMRAHMVHLAPEVARGSRGDGRSDVFSLGVMLHEMFYGPRFPRGLSAAQALQLAREGEVTRPVTAPLLPPAIAAIIDRALSVDPRERQQHAGVLAYDLRRESLALGVTDGRMFLRSTLFEMSEGVHDAQ